MRSPHNPEPSLNLGDDPDIGAEIGSRLAASSQTAQGLLTNYLFYGQRRSGTGQGAAATDLARGRAHERSSEGARSAAVGQCAQTAENSQADTRGAPVLALPGEGRPSGPAGTVGKPKLRLVLRSEGSGETKHEADPLAAESLGDDPLAKDPLVTPPRQDSPSPAPRDPTRGAP